MDKLIPKKRWFFRCRAALVASGLCLAPLACASTGMYGSGGDVAPTATLPGNAEFFVPTALQAARDRLAEKLPESPIDKDGAARFGVMAAVREAQTENRSLTTEEQDALYDYVRARLK